MVVPQMFCLLGSFVAGWRAWTDQPHIFPPGVAGRWVGGDSFPLQEIVVKQEFARQCEAVQEAFPGLQIKHDGISRSLRTEKSKVTIQASPVGRCLKEVGSSLIPLSPLKTSPNTAPPQHPNVLCRSTARWKTITGGNDSLSWGGTTENASGGMFYYFI